jgi:subtilisin
VRGETEPGQYIVVLKTSTSNAKDTRSIADESRAEGIEVRHLYEHAITGFAIRIPNERALDNLLQNPRVDYVQPDLKVKAFSQTLPTGVDRVDGDTSLAKSGDGSGAVNVDVAVLDTGIDLNHPDLNV